MNNKNMNIAAFYNFKISCHIYVDMNGRYIFFCDLILKSKLKCNKYNKQFT